MTSACPVERRGDGGRVWRSPLKPSGLVVALSPDSALPTVTLDAEDPTS